MYFSKDADSIPTFESPWIHRGWTPAAELLLVVLDEQHSWHRGAVGPGTPPNSASGGSQTALPHMRAGKGASDQERRRYSDRHGTRVRGRSSNFCVWATVGWGHPHRQVPAKTSVPSEPSLQVPGG